MIKPLKFLFLPLLLSGCAHGLLGGLSSVDTSAFMAMKGAHSAETTHSGDHPPDPRTPFDTRFMVGGKEYTYEMLGFKNAREYARYHDRKDPSAPSFSADEYKSGAYRYAKSGERGSVSWRISQYKHRGEGDE